MRVRQWVLILAMIPCLFLISACGGSAGNGETGNSEYRKMNLVMSVNGTDTQIDTRVARCFALVTEPGVDDPCTSRRGGAFPPRKGGSAFQVFSSRQTEICESYFPFKIESRISLVLSASS